MKWLRYLRDESKALYFIIICLVRDIQDKIIAQVEREEIIDDRLTIASVFDYDVF